MMDRVVVGVFAALVGFPPTFLVWLMMWKDRDRRDG